MQVSFRATLFSLMLTVLLIGVLSLGLAAYFYAQFSANDLGGQVLQQTVERVAQHVRHSLQEAESEAETIEDLMVQGTLDSSDHEAVTDYFVSALKARPGLSYLSFGMPSGKYYHAFRDREGNLSVLWLVPNEKDQGASRRLIEFELPENGVRKTVRDIAESVRTPPYQRPYYQATVKAGRPIWTESYVFLGSGESLDFPGVSRAIPVYSSTEDDDQLQGVLTADFDLFAMSKFIREVNLGSGVSFIVEETSSGERKVLAHPKAADPDPSKRLDLTDAGPEGEGRITVRADRVPDPLVRQFISTQADEFRRVSPGETQTAELQVGRNQFVGSYLQMDGEGSPKWIIGMFLPKSEVFGGVTRMARLMAVLGIVGVVVATLLSLLLSRRVADTLGIIADETKEIGSFRIERKKPVRSRIREISTLASAMEEMKTGLRSFQKYVPADLVRLLLESGQEAELGGARSDLTIYFSDIVGFTSVSEQVDPETLVAVLSDYLEEMSDEILQAGGTVDKFIGDAIMAFWGAPLAQEEHARAACHAALANQARLEELRDDWKGRDLPEFRARIGLHSGNAIVGNFGSPNRLDYTAIGDSVNLASRLEGLNRIYGTDILISEATFKAIGPEFITRRIDRVAVKGREGSTLVYELVGKRKNVSKIELEWIADYEGLVDLYFAKKWAEARKGFAALQETRPGNASLQLMIHRCDSLIASTQREDWDGVFHAPKG